MVDPEEAADVLDQMNVEVAEIRPRPFVTVAKEIRVLSEVRGLRVALLHRPPVLGTPVLRSVDLRFHEELTEVMTDRDGEPHQAVRRFDPIPVVMAVLHELHVVIEDIRIRALHLMKVLAQEEIERLHDDDVHRPRPPPLGSNSLRWRPITSRSLNRPSWK